MLVFYRATSSELLPTPVYNLFVQKCVQDDYLLQLLKYADSVSNWVAAEIVSSYSSKVCNIFSFLMTEFGWRLLHCY